MPDHATNPHVVSEPQVWFQSQVVAMLCADLTLAMIPRSVTMALALPIAQQLHASAGITALGVMLTGHFFPSPLPGNSCACTVARLHLCLACTLPE